LNIGRRRRPWRSNSVSLRSNSLSRETGPTI